VLPTFGGFLVGISWLVLLVGFVVAGSRGLSWGCAA
jgi:hypothetical protein